MTYYRPAKYSKDKKSVNLEDVPEELGTNLAFACAEDCIEWLNQMYDSDDYAILAIDENEIEPPVVIIDADSVGLTSYTVDVTFTHSIAVNVLALDEDDAMDKAETKASEIFAENLDNGLIGTSDFTCEAQTP